MKKSDIEYQIQELKSDYIRLQNDLEKMESVGGNIAPLERQLEEIEKQLAELRKQL